MTSTGNSSAPSRQNDRTPLLASFGLQPNHSQPYGENLNNDSVDSSSRPSTPRIARHPSIEMASEAAAHISTLSFTGIIRGLSTHVTGPTTSQKGASGKGGDECRLCMEKKAVGLYCKEKHFICRDECFAMYVSSVCEETYKLKLHKGRITCPYPDCKSIAWTSKEVREGLAGHSNASDTYTEALLELLGGDIESGTGDIALTTHSSSTETVEAKTDRIKEMVCDALTLKCPNPMCRLALDPNPDGCCSMTCLKCGIHFCWLCFTVTGTDSGVSHKHVQGCSENPMPNNLFVPAGQVEEVHKRRRLEAIRRSLLSAEGNSWQSSEICEAAITAASRILKDSNISRDDVFNSTEIAPPTPKEVLLEGLDFGMPDIGPDIVAPPPPLYMDPNVVLLLNLVIVCIGSTFNYQDAAVYKYAKGVTYDFLYYLAVIMVCCFPVLVGVTYTRMPPGQGLVVQLFQSVVGGIVAASILLIVFALVGIFCVALYEGFFFVLDFFLAEVTGGSLMGSSYWHSGTGLIPSLTSGVISSKVCHIIFLVIASVARLLASLFQRRLHESEKGFFKLSTALTVIVVALAVFQDNGIDHTGYLLQHWGYLFLGMSFVNAV